MPPASRLCTEWGFYIIPMIKYSLWQIDDNIIRCNEDTECEYSIKVALTDPEFCIKDMKKNSWYTQRHGVQFLNILKMFI
jgi:hypothetical protein